jgi:hypothetical protein
MASRLETRRYAAMLGATVELNKMEGISIDIANNRLYMGISSVDNGMLDEPLNADKGGNVRYNTNICIVLTYVTLLIIVGYFFSTVLDTILYA